VREICTLRSVGTGRAPASGDPVVTPEVSPYPDHRRILVVSSASGRGRVSTNVPFVWRTPNLALE